MPRQQDKNALDLDEVDVLSGVDDVERNNQMEVKFHFTRFLYQLLAHYTLKTVLDL